MPFVHENYKIERIDPLCLGLFEFKEAERKKLVTGKYKGKITEKPDRWEQIGYYSSFSSAFRGMVDRLSERAGDLAELKDIWDSVMDSLPPSYKVPQVLSQATSPKN